jgi:hypothetical protein
MLPVSAWPPGPPGASLSPFGKPRDIDVGRHGCHGFVIPKGAWVVDTRSNRVVMFRPKIHHFNPARSPGTGLLPGSIPPNTPPPPPTCNVFRPKFRRFNDTVEAFRAWQRKTGDTDPPLRPLAGHRPPNWYGWKFVDAPSSTLLQPGASGLVIADGQNVVIFGCGCATITQAFSV